MLHVFFYALLRIFPSLNPYYHLISHTIWPSDLHSTLLQHRITGFSMYLHLFTCPKSPRYSTIQTHISKFIISLVYAFPKFKSKSKVKIILKYNSHIPCRSPASAVSFVKVHMVGGNIRNANPLLVTFVELRVAAGRSRTRAGCPHAVSRRPMLIHTYHAVPMPWPWEAAFRTAWSWHGRRTAWHVWIKHGRAV
jgi:hypothetical protein